MKSKTDVPPTQRESQANKRFGSWVPKEFKEASKNSRFTKKFSPPFLEKLARLGVEMMTTQSDKNISVKEKSLVGVSTGKSVLCVSKKICYGDRIRLNKNWLGEVAYIGPLAGKEGDWYGISLEEERGKHNGTYEKHKYFVTRMNHGVFAKMNQIESVVSPSVLYGQRLSIHDVVYLRSLDKCGSIKFIGYFHLCEMEMDPRYRSCPYVGVELSGTASDSKDTRDVHDHHYYPCKNGKFGGISYFHCSPSKGSVIVPFEMVTSSSSSSSCPPNDRGSNASMAIVRDAQCLPKKRVHPYPRSVDIVNQRSPLLFHRSPQQHNTTTTTTTTTATTAATTTTTTTTDTTTVTHGQQTNNNRSKSLQPLVDAPNHHVDTRSKFDSPFVPSHSHVAIFNSANERRIKREPASLVKSGLIMPIQLPVHQF
ncbi:hypothetical protein RFI_08134 [Reticulomyxa filosa]|uniref:CAP-Gly domain-containing protein n=1 Tax=Reticulomyxa filosa TaxID=46433 RepID=X6NRT2_RETFI|nr:hypothetical protein RFI_08134 [Reticulomyxa filosa]|eukprot:ETO28990.1 hypothetical protein RFI_08134 [Reticulomyxa filosa]